MVSSVELEMDSSVLTQCDSRPNNQSMNMKLYITVSKDNKGTYSMIHTTVNILKHIMLVINIGDKMYII